MDNLVNNITTKTVVTICFYDMVFLYKLQMHPQTNRNALRQGGVPPLRASKASVGTPGPPRRGQFENEQGGRRDVFKG